MIDLADSGIYTVKDLDRALIKMHELDKSQYSAELQKQFYVTGLSLESKQRFVLKESEDLELSLYRLHDKTAYCIEEIRMLSDICKNNIGCSSIALDIYASMNDNSILFVYDGACARLREAISTLKASDIDFLTEHYFSGKTPEQLSIERGIEKTMYFRKLHGVFGRLTFGGVYQYICGYTENAEGEVTGIYPNKFNSKRYRAFINMFDKIKKNSYYKIGEEYSKYKKGFKLQEAILIEDRYALKEVVHNQICTDAGLK